ncbi:Phage tail fiber protein [plant metagenome]|uniref:Phage tail fiber protein n=1 Tax=plant metagenome TaxID=1297885 RepID=A0A484P6T8_9ZZZZ
MMRETNPEGDAWIARQLDTLADAGRRSLSHVAHRAALERAVRWAAPAAVPAPLLFCLASAFSRVDVVWMLLVSAAVPLSVQVAAYVVFRSRQVIDRRAALGVFDARLQAGDRIGSADQFLHEGHGDGFRAAAVQDAQPWIERALALPAKALDAGRLDWPRRAWVFPLAALALLGLAMLLPGARGPWIDEMGSSSAAASPQALLTQQPETVAGDAQRPVGSEDAEHSGASAAIQPGEGGGAAPAAGGDASQSGARPSSPGPQRDGGRMAPRGAAASASSETVANAPVVAASANSAGRAMAASAEALQRPTPSQVQADGGEGGDGEPGIDSRGANPLEDTADSPAQAGLPSTGSRGNPPPSQPRAGEQGPSQPSQRNPSQRGDQGQGQGQGQGNREGQQGQGRSAGEGIKRTRGVSGLLLGVPMEDRLIGTANPGRIKSLPRPAQPTATQTTPDRAQARGEGHGDAGEIIHRPSGAEDERLVRDYFMRQREGAGPQDQDDR